MDAAIILAIVLGSSLLSFLQEYRASTAVEECSLDIREHYTDTAGAVDHVFGLCHLTGFRFAPRIRDLADRRLYVSDARSSYGPLDPMIGGAIDFRIIGENWDETLRGGSALFMIICRPRRTRAPHRY
nr:Tn3 family transposase [Methylocystis rosea]